MGILEQIQDVQDYWESIAVSNNLLNNKNAVYGVGTNFLIFRVYTTQPLLTTYSESVTRTQNYYLVEELIRKNRKKKQEYVPANTLGTLFRVFEDGKVRSAWCVIFHDHFAVLKDEELDTYLDFLPYDTSLVTPLQKLFKKEEFFNSISFKDGFVGKTYQHPYVRFSASNLQKGRREFHVKFKYTDFYVDTGQPSVHIEYKLFSRNFNISLQTLEEGYRFVEKLYETYNNLKDLKELSFEYLGERISLNETQVDKLRAELNVDFFYVSEKWCLLLTAEPITQLTQRFGHHFDLPFLYLDDLKRTVVAFLPAHLRYSKFYKKLFEQKRELSKE